MFLFYYMNWTLRLLTDITFVTGLVLLWLLIMEKSWVWCIHVILQDVFKDYFNALSLLYQQMAWMSTYVSMSDTGKCPQVLPTLPVPSKRPLFVQIVSGLQNLCVRDFGAVHHTAWPPQCLPDFPLHFCSLPPLTATMIWIFHHHQLPGIHTWLLPCRPYLSSIVNLWRRLSIKGHHGHHDYFYWHE